jgi:CxxC motif-containing protein (DUF1111 family)
MNVRFMFVLSLLLLTAPLALGAEGQSAQPAETPTSAELGHRLFVRRFIAGQRQPTGGDGLGPLFNHVSCAACHKQGGLGGGGHLEFNVSLLSAQVQSGSARPDDKHIRATLKSLHPAFVSGDGKIVPNILLHRYGPGQAYSQLKTSLGGAETPIGPDDIERAEMQRELARTPLPVAKLRNRIQLVLAQRNTTALFGAGLIDEIQDETLRELAVAQAADGLSGRVPPIGPNKVGRFGWRGQQEHLHDFVLGACANELGLQVPGNPQPMNPLQPNYRPAGLDLTDAQCRQLTAFIRSLPPPKFIEPATAMQRLVAHNGKNLFYSIGCATCHVEQIDHVDGIFSDLLLHDMGPQLADPVLAAPTLILQYEVSKNRNRDQSVNVSIPRAIPDPPPQPTPPNNYYGGQSFTNLALGASPPTTVRITDAATGVESQYSIQTTPLDREWRTPPLWGVADSPPYLHDGRAATLDDAIALHGGEADECMRQYRRLSLEDRQAIVEFLKCLKAP